MPGFIAGGTNWTHPLLQQINRQGDIIQYADQAQRANEQLKMQKQNFLMQVEEKLKARAAEEQLKNAMRESVSPEGTLDLKALAGKIAPFDPKSSIGIMTKLQEIEAEKAKRSELTKFQEESLGLRRDMAEDSKTARAAANADRDAARADRELSRAEMSQYRQAQLEETKKKNLRDEQGTKPPKDYRWNANKELEPIPGSKVDAKIRAEYSADTANIQRIEDTLDRTVSTIDQLLKNDNGLKWITGYTGYAPDFVSQDKTDAAAKLEELKSRIFVQAIESMRSTSKTGSTGFGQLTEREGDKIQNSFANLQKAQSHKQLVAALNDIKSVIEASRARIKRQYATEWEGREPKELGKQQTWTPQNLDLEVQTADDLFKQLEK